MRLVAKDINNMGHAKVDVNHAPAMGALAGRVKALRTHPTVVAESPEYEPQANGLAERFVQTVKGCSKRPGAR